MRPCALLFALLAAASAPAGAAERWSTEEKVLVDRFRALQAEAQRLAGRRGGPVPVEVANTAAVESFDRSVRKLHEQIGACLKEARDAEAAALLAWRRGF